jgi:hypothetical protein
VKIVVNHLTRMQQGYICVSGLKLGTCHHVRPILSGNRLSTGLLRRNGGPFDMAVIVDLGTVKPHPQNPEVEDHIFDPTKATAIGTLTSSKFWTLLTQVAERKLVSIFWRRPDNSGDKVMWGRRRQRCSITWLSYSEFST